MLRISESIDVAAAPELVYDMVSDVTTAPDWAAETYRCDWLGDATGPAVGASFQGRNRNGQSKWATVCTVTAAEPGRRFAFRVKVLGMKVANWSYDIEPTPEGCRVTETNEILANLMISRLLAPMATGVKDRVAQNKRNIALTLQQLKQAAEARATLPGTPAQ